MGKSPTKTKGRREGRSSPQLQQGDDGGRGITEAKTGSSVGTDTQGGTGERGGDDDDDQHHRPHSPRAR